MLFYSGTEGKQYGAHSVSKEQRAFFCAGGDAHVLCAPPRSRFRHGPSLRKGCLPSPAVFRTLVGHEISVELKNDITLTGVLESVDQFLNLKLDRTRVHDEHSHPQLSAVHNCFVRGSVVRYIRLPQAAVDTDALHDATRREARSASS